MKKVFLRVFIIVAIVTFLPLLSKAAICDQESKLTLNVHDFKGQATSGLHFSLYKQNVDGNGLPVLGDYAEGGEINSYGQGTINFHPDSSELYVLKIWDRRDNLGEFLFFDAIKFTCGYDRTINKTIPALNVVLRDQNGNLKREYSFSLYEQRYDADDQPVWEDNDLIANLRTNKGGQSLIYVAPYNSYNSSQTGIYALKSKDSSGNYVTTYNIVINPNQDYNFEQIFSGLSGQLTDAFNQVQGEKDIYLYQQIGVSNGNVLGKLLLKQRTDPAGYFHFDYLSGKYALVIMDDFNQKNIFWNININNQNRNNNLVSNVTNLTFSKAQLANISGDIYFNLFKLVNSNGLFYQGEKISDIKLGIDKTSLVSLATGPYLLTYTSDGGSSFGRAFYAENGKSQTIELGISRDYLISPNKSYHLTIPTYNTNITSALAKRLSGRILLQVEDKGQAWYINPDNNKRYYLGRPADAFNVMRTLGLGISNNDFNNIENNPPSRLYGKILLKVEDNGRAYYVDPVSHNLYYLGRPADAFNVMRTLGLGITDSDLGQININ